MKSTDWSAATSEISGNRVSCTSIRRRSVNRAQAATTSATKMTGSHMLRVYLRAKSVSEHSDANSEMSSENTLNPESAFWADFGQRTGAEPRTPRIWSVTSPRETLGGIERSRTASRVAPVPERLALSRMSAKAARAQPMRMSKKVAKSPFEPFGHASHSPVGRT
eukprot:Amastigsp_a681434_4.p4 type:complete len:165 gc:universal Amastigsp_a681434_4:235-729(+)